MVNLESITVSQIFWNWETIYFMENLVPVFRKEMIMCIIIETLVLNKIIILIFIFIGPHLVIAIEFFFSVGINIYLILILLLFTYF